MTKTKALPTIKGLYSYKGEKSDLDHETLAYVEGILHEHEQHAKEMLEWSELNLRLPWKEESKKYWRGRLEAVQSLQGEK